MKHDPVHPDFEFLTPKRQARIYPSLEHIELLRARHRLGYNQTQMATAIGLSLRRYQDIERGYAPFRQFHRLALKRVVEVAAELDELERLRTENASLRAQLAAA